MGGELGPSVTKLESFRWELKRSTIIHGKAVTYMPMESTGGCGHSLKENAEHNAHKDLWET